MHQITGFKRNCGEIKLREKNRRIQMVKILIADDEPIERTIIERMIARNFSENVQIVKAVNGREAVELYAKEQCQIALLDIEMPGMNGLDAADEIRKMDKDAVIIFVTAYDEFDYAKRAIQVRALEYLLKPLSEEELTANLEEAIYLTQKTDKKQSVVKVDSQDNHHENIKMNAVAETIRNFIANHYKEDISLQDVAGSLNYSDAYFCKIFKQCFNKSFLVYLTEYRVERAKVLLADMSINIKDVSAEVGYRDSNYFARVFKRSEGITPTDYRLRVLHNAKKGD